MDQDNRPGQPQTPSSPAPQTSTEDQISAADNPRALLYMEWSELFRSLINLVFHPLSSRTTGGPARQETISRGLIALITSIVLAWILTPAMFSVQQDYDISDSDIGHVSQKVIKADRDYDIPDTEATERKVQEAKNTVLPVYIEDQSFALAANERVGRAFDIMRDAIKAAEAQVQRAKEERQAEIDRRAALAAQEAAAKKTAEAAAAAAMAEHARRAAAGDGAEGAAAGADDERASDSRKSGPEADALPGESQKPEKPAGKDQKVLVGQAPDQIPSAAASVLDDLPPLPEIPDKSALCRRSFEELKELWYLTLGLEVSSLSDELFQALADDLFSERTQEIIESLIRRAYTHGVAENRDTIAIAARTGITLLKMNGAEVQRELTLRDAGEITDLREISQQMQQWVAEYRRDLQKKPPRLREAVLTIATRLVRINLIPNAAETERRRTLAAETVKPVIIQLKKGERIIGDGEKIEPRHIVIFAAVREQASALDMASVRLGIAVLAILVILIVQAFARTVLRRYSLSVRDELVFSVILITMLSLAKLLIFIIDSLRDHLEQLSPEALYFIVPVTAGAMLIRVTMSMNAALVFAAAQSILIGFTTENSQSLCVYTALCSLVAITRLSRNIDRPAIFKAGLWSAGAGLLAVAALSLARTRFGMAEMLYASLFAAISGTLLSPAIVTALTPICERFGYTTDMKLMELNNLNHPLIKRLMMEAPGTYNHSSQLMTLVEAGAEAIGANPLLAKVCALYHDVGKLTQPTLFAENQNGAASPLNDMKPSMASQSIQSHVKEGFALAREYRLPAPVADATQQHHGTRVTGFFFKKAMNEKKAEIYQELLETRQRQQPEAGPITNEELERFEVEAKRRAAKIVNKADFSYPGPIPQSIEVALVMLADVVEATTRAQKPGSAEELKAIIRRSVDDIFREGQLADCDLTLKDLDAVEEAFFSVLKGSNHSRPKYPPEASMRKLTGESQLRAGTPLPQLGTPQPGSLLTQTPTPIPLNRLMPSKPPSAVPTFVGMPALIPVSQSAPAGADEPSIPTPAPAADAAAKDAPPAEEDGR